MKKIYKIFVLIIGLLFARVSYSQIKPHIIGGYNINIAQVPWQVSIEDASTRAHFCGGILVAPDWVMTAAHCTFAVNNDPKAIKILAGVTNNQDFVTGQTANASTIIPNPSFNSQTFQNDVALIHLTAPLMLNSNVQPIAISNCNVPSALLAPGTTYLLTGWGLISDGGQTTNMLQGINLPIISDATANSIFGSSYPLVVPTMIPFYKSGGAASNGDSGGPASITIGNQSYAGGITSWGGYPGTKSRYPSVYTNVQSYSSWIYSNILKNSPIQGPGVLSSCGTYFGTYNGAVVIPGATYTWTATSGLTVIPQGSTATILLNSGTKTDQTLTLTTTICGSTFINTLPIAVGLLSDAAIFTGPPTVDCSTAGTFQVQNPISGVSYAWSVDANFILVSKTRTSITLKGVSGKATGNLKLTARYCNITRSSSQTISTNGLTSQATNISGPSSLDCSSSGTIFSVANPVSGGVYNWTNDAGLSIQGTTIGTSVTVLPAPGHSTGNLTLKVTNCGSSISKTIPISLLNNLTASNAVFSGASSVNGNCSQSYSAGTAIPGATYHWTVSPGLSIISGQGTPYVSLNATGSGTANLTLTVSKCGASFSNSKSVSVNLPNLSQVGTYVDASGTHPLGYEDGVCPGQVTVTFNFGPTAYNYSWQNAMTGQTGTGNTVSFIASTSNNTGFGWYATIPCYGNIQGSTYFTTVVCAATRFTIFPNPSSNSIKVVNVEFDEKRNQRLIKGTSNNRLL